MSKNLIFEVMGPNGEHRAVYLNDRETHVVMDFVAELNAQIGPKDQLLTATDVIAISVINRGIIALAEETETPAAGTAGESK